MATKKKQSKKKAKKKAIAKNKGGRPSPYNKKIYPEQAKKLCLLGAIDLELADFFGIQESTLYVWKTKHPEFTEALKEGKKLANANVALRLYERAMGYSHPEDKIFNNNGSPLIVPTTKHYAPDTTAAIFWLKNRDPDNWRDVHKVEGKIDHDHSGEVVHKISDGMNFNQVQEQRDKLKLVSSQ